MSPHQRQSPKGLNAVCAPFVTLVPMCPGRLSLRGCRRVTSCGTHLRACAPVSLALSESLRAWLDVRPSACAPRLCTRCVLLCVCVCVRASFCGSFLIT